MQDVAVNSSVTPTAFVSTWRELWPLVKDLDDLKIVMRTEHDTQELGIWFWMNRVEQDYDPKLLFDVPDTLYCRIQNRYAGKFHDKHFGTFGYGQSTGAGLSEPIRAESYEQRRQSSPLSHNGQPNNQACDDWPELKDMIERCALSSGGLRTTRDICVRVKPGVPYCRVQARVVGSILDVLLTDQAVAYIQDDWKKSFLDDLERSIY